MNTDDIVAGLRFAEDIRGLDYNSGLKIALALAGTNPTLFRQLLDVTKKQNIVPVSTLVLKPAPAVPVNMVG